MSTMREQHKTPKEPDLTATGEGEMLDFSTFTNGFVRDIQSYTTAQKRYLLLHASEKVSTLFAKLLRSTITAVALSFVLLFFNIALALLLGEQLHSVPLGFVCVAGIYLLLFGLFLLYWSNGGRDRFIVDRINDLTDGDDLP